MRAREFLRESEDFVVDDEWFNYKNGRVTGTIWRDKGTVVQPNTTPSDYREFSDLLRHFKRWGGIGATITVDATKMSPEDRKRWVADMREGTGTVQQVIVGDKTLTKAKQPDEDYEYLYWFWFNPTTGVLEHVEGTHTTYAYYEMGFKIRDLTPEERRDGLDMADDDILKAVIDAGWVRGRYGNQAKNIYGTMSWDYQEFHDPNTELSLQGERKNVWKTALHIAKQWPFSTLYVDFGTAHEGMESTKLTGERLEFFLKNGRVPSRMVQGD